MILLEVHNRVIEDMLTLQIETFLRKEKSVDVKANIVDFDGALYNIVNNRNEPFLVSIKLKFYRDLEEHGIDAVNLSLSLRGRSLQTISLDPSTCLRRSSGRPVRWIQCDHCLRLRHSVGE